MADVAAIILAAGRASRFAAGPEDSKLFAPLAGVPLVRHVAAAALASRASRTVVVTGHAATKVAAALAGLSVAFVHNAAFATGLASSLKAGVAALPADTRGALILLGDMPLVARGTLDALIAAFELEHPAPDAVVPVHDGRWGNPILIGRALFDDLARLSGDEGARKILTQRGRGLVLCPVGDPGIAIDIDTREALRALDDGALEGNA